MPLLVGRACRRGMPVPATADLQLDAGQHPGEAEFEGLLGGEREVVVLIPTGVSRLGGLVLGDEGITLSVPDLVQHGRDRLPPFVRVDRRGRRRCGRLGGAAGGAIDVGRGPPSHQRTDPRAIARSRSFVPRAPRPAAFLFPGLMSRGVTGWLTFLWVVILGMLAAMPIAIIIGSLAPSVQKVGSWGMLPMLVLLGISGIFYPVQAMWTWLQGVAQMFPLYWLGLGMRSAFLPPAAAAIELGGSWRTLQTVLVLAAWAVLGLALAPPVLRRMARKQSGSRVEAARQEATQWVR